MENELFEGLMGLFGESLYLLCTWGLSQEYQLQERPELQTPDLSNIRQPTTPFKQTIKNHKLFP